MRFVIDETSWRFDGLASGTCIESLETMLDQLDVALAHGQKACYSDELFNAKVYQNKSFYELYAPDSPLLISREVQERIASIFIGLSKWEDLQLEWPTSFDVQIDGAIMEEAPSIAWAHKQLLQNPAHYIACMVFPSGRQAGIFDVTVDAKTHPIWFVADNKNYCDFFRWLIVETTKNHDEMELFASSAFPSLDFVDHAFDGISHMSKPYRELARPLIHHLGAMSDHGKRIFLGPRDQIEAEFGALGVNISNENGNTRGNSDARKERTIEIDGADIVFWWHSKLERHQDRIHINPDRIAGGGRLLVGIFCKHLT